MISSNLVKGKAYDYVRKDGSRHTVTYMYAGVNLFMFKMQHGNGVLSLSYSTVNEHIQEKQ